MCRDCECNSNNKLVIDETNSEHHDPNHTHYSVGHSHPESKAQQNNYLAKEETTSPSDFPEVFFSSPPTVERGNIVNSEYTGGEYELADGFLPPQEGPPPHRHFENDEAWYVLSGQVAFQSGDQSFVATPGDFIYAPKGELHSFQNLETTPGATRIVQVTNPPGLLEYIVQLGMQGTDSYYDRLVTLSSQYATEVADSVFFEQSEYTINEQDMTAGVTLRRVGNSEDTASVTISLSDGTAELGKDYEGKEIEVKFDPTETTQTVEVPISLIDDNLVEENETIRLSLGNYEGKGIIAPLQNEAVISIVDNDNLAEEEASILNSSQQLNLPTLQPDFLTQFVPVEEITVDSNNLNAEGSSNNTSPNSTFESSLNYSLTDLINSVEEVNSYLMSFEQPQAVEFLSNWQAEDFLQNAQALLQERISLPVINPIVGSFEDDYLRSSSDQSQKISGLGGNDVIFSVSGNDLLFGGSGDDIVNPGLGDDIVIGGNGNDEPRGNFGDDILSGGNGDEFLNGGPGNDLLFGGSGQDFIFGNGDGGNGSGDVDDDGDDILIGGSGNDALISEEGNDIVIDAEGENTIFGGAGNDLIFGGSGKDRVGGGTGNNIIFGQGEDDILAGADGEDYIDGGYSNDTIIGFSNNDTLVGAQGNDTLIGVDELNSQFGFGKGEIDLLIGGKGEDTFVLGHTEQPYYQNHNSDSLESNDYAIISDFNFQEMDKIQLSGLSNDYILDNFSSNLASGTAIFLKDSLGTDRQTELIGIVEGLEAQSMNLNDSSQFVFV